MIQRQCIFQFAKFPHFGANKEKKDSFVAINLLREETFFSFYLDNCQSRFSPLFSTNTYTINCETVEESPNFCYSLISSFRKQCCHMTLGSFPILKYSKNLTIRYFHMPSSKLQIWKNSSERLFQITVLLI